MRLTVRVKFRVSFLLGFLRLWDPTRDPGLPGIHCGELYIFLAVR